MTTPNKITLVRILMIPAFVLMALYYGASIKRGQPLEWQRYTAIVIFLVAAASDGLDGYIARRYNQKSALGVILDPIADKGLLLSGIITLSISNWSDVDPQYGQFPTWFPVLVISRDVVILVGSAVLHLLNGKVRVQTSWTGKVATFLQMMAIAWVMLQLMFIPLIYVVAAAGFFTFVSGVDLCDGWLPSARREGAGERQLALRRIRNMDAKGTRNVAIVGRPNVGKSALFNRLAGRNIAIVHDQPGITRDRISAVSKRGAEPFTIWDTGGIGGAGETELLQEVRAAAAAAMHEADLILFIVDAQQGLTPIDQELARLLRRSKRPVVLVVNKIDHPKHEDLAAEFSRLGFASVESISAAHGRGIDSLVETIDRLLPKSEIRNPKSEISTPLSLAIIGRPNVGKSSLINAILSDRRTIVSHLPGTTRDAVDIAYRHGPDDFVLIDTAGIRARGKHSSSVEVFSVMRSERTIRRADLCVLVIDATIGVTSQDKKIAALMQKAHKPSLIVVNKWDLVKPDRGARERLAELIAETRERLFFLAYAPILIASALTGENVERLFSAIRKVRRAARERLGTGVLNRLLRAAFAANPPPMVSGKRMKLFYATQARGLSERRLDPPEFVLFVNDPKLLGQTYERYLEAQIREAQPFPGLPVLLNFRPRSETTPTLSS